MKQRKKHDCVELKNRIQQELLESYKNKTDGQRVQAIEDKLASSKSPIAIFWQKYATLRVSDRPGTYQTRRGKSNREENKPNDL